MDTVQHFDLLFVILAAAVATFATRVGGYVLITQLKHIPPRLEAALNAVPAAVLTTLVAPAFVSGGIEVAASMLVAFAVGLRFSTLRMLVVGWAVVMAIRHGIL
ncbi:AzlD family protein [Sinorhizobium alkalisoli]|uniref:Uncharacterized protein n=1 Tax=Sinorhizobium alkalisoli TaxID=1752398 RepID=A0A1E3V3V1_9HYPH|nr:AzlD family protein [Sinorhizobium alkalisoli]MCA1491673.1 AzlD family protein [Ensifer sp. NBAIM29]MCG5479779.1 AzlD family protein [Sinorhizobium alkalisoli]ODR88239.1 hypothetical protein A8M32_27190 [Sinorhizobium alkalisoli]QFI67028.1 putative transmembrane protein [Sinorhizobium alkalisoli]